MHSISDTFLMHLSLFLHLIFHGRKNIDIIFQNVAFQIQLHVQ